MRAEVQTILSALKAVKESPLTALRYTLSTMQMTRRTRCRKGMRLVRPQLAQRSRRSGTLFVKISWLALTAFKAVQFLSDPRVAAFPRERPLADRKGRIMSYVLVMAAFELRAPVLFGVVIETDDLPFHLGLARSR